MADGCESCAMGRHVAWFSTGTSCHRQTGNISRDHASAEQPDNAQLTFSHIHSC